MTGVPEQWGAVADPTGMARYLDDPLKLGTTRPLAVLRPASTAEVQAALRWCAAKGLAVVPQGGLTGLTGAAVPPAGRPTVILSLERMKNVRAIDRAGETITVEAGAVLGDVRDRAEAEGLYFPLFHGAVGSSQIGGNLSTNSGGNNALRYGTARDQVLGLEVVLPDGTLWDGLRALRKNTAGYDLRQLFIGAEGTLGIVTAAVLKLRAHPHNRVTGFVAVTDPKAALELLDQLKTHLGETISAFELLSDASLDCALMMEGTRYPLETRAPWAVLIEAETAATGFDLGAALEAGLAEAFETGLISDAAIAQNGTQRDSFWHLRESIAVRLLEDESCLKMDTAVPVGLVPDFIAAASGAVLARLPGTRITPFGHLGDGNIHFNLVRPEAMSHAAFRDLWHELASMIAGESLALGGTISAEHGIGRLKRSEFLTRTDPVALGMMKGIKAAFDPDDRMNPGVLF